MGDCFTGVEVFEAVDALPGTLDTFVGLGVDGAAGFESLPRVGDAPALALVREGEADALAFEARAGEADAFAFAGLLARPDAALAAALERAGELPRDGVLPRAGVLPLRDEDDAPRAGDSARAPLLRPRIGTANTQRIRENTTRV